MTKKWYLAGPICHVKDDSDREWRDRAKEVLDYIDPFEQEAIGGLVGDNGESPKERFNRLRAGNKLHQVRDEMVEILRIDKEAVDAAFGLLVHSPSPSWGTIRECTLAHEQGKPIVLWTPQKGVDLANTQIAVSSIIVDNFADAIKACKEIEELACEV